MDTDPLNLLGYTTKANLNFCPVQSERYNNHNEVQLPGIFLATK
jgi:hypothetical protein